MAERHPLALPAGVPPVLLVVIDTEEEFDWNAPFDRTSRGVCNIAEQSHAQSIMDSYGIVPTYVIDHPVAATAQSVSVLQEFVARGSCEVGAHLHPWVTPPYEEAVNARNSFPGNLPAALEHAKLQTLRDVIAENFPRPEIYKAGRYGLGPRTFETLAALGFSIDASIVPHTDFRGYEGPDFSSFSPHPFSSEEGIVALPLSVHFVGQLAAAGSMIYPVLQSPAARMLRLPGIAARLSLLERLRLSPEGHSLGDLCRQTRAALSAGERIFMLTYHSSTLLPGATSYVPDEAARTRFLTTLEHYFRFFLTDCGGTTMPLSKLAKTLIRAD